MKTPKLVVQNKTFSDFIVHAACHTDSLGDGCLFYLARTGARPATKF